MVDLDDLKPALLAYPGVRAEYDAMEQEFAIARELIAARDRAGLSQAELAVRMGTTLPLVPRRTDDRQKG